MSSNVTAIKPDKGRKPKPNVNTDVNSKPESMGKIKVSMPMNTPSITDIPIPPVINTQKRHSDAPVVTTTSEKTTRFGRKSVPPVRFQ